jgi:PAS domain S-box-containing protein
VLFKDVDPDWGRKTFPTSVLSRFSVRAILLAGAVVMAFGFTLLVASASMHSVRRLVIESSLERKALIAQELAWDYEQFLLLHLAAVETVARHAAAGPGLDMAVLRPLLERTNAGYPALWGIGVTDHTGRLVAASPPVTDEGASAVGLDLSDREWFKQMQQTRRPVIDRRVVVGRVMARPTITVNAPIVDARGTLRGAVTGGLDLGHVRELAERIRLGETGVVNVASADAVLFAGGAAGHESTDVSALPIWSRMVEPSGQIESYRDAQGRARLAAFATVPSVGWKVWVSQELAEVEGEVGAAYRSLLGWLLAGLAVLVGVAVLLGLAVTRPLRAADRTAAAIAAGDLDRRAPEQGPREVAGLARSLNRMAETLRRRLEAERDGRARLQAVLSDYARLAARVAGGDLSARVDPAGQGDLAELGQNLNRMAADLERQVAGLQAATEEARRERERVDRILASITDGFIAVDRDWRFVYVNRRAAEVIAQMGRPAEGLLGRVLWDEFPELRESPVGEEYRRAMRDRVTTQFQFRGPTLGRWYEVRVYPAAEGLSIYFTDVTDRRRAEEELARFKIIADRATEAYLLCNSETRIVYANRLAAERLGYSVDELLTLSAAVIDPLYSRELVDELVARSRRGETITPFESLHRRRDGSTFPVETSLTVVELDGEPYLFAAARDITLRKRTEQQLREESEALETVNRVSRVLSAELDLQKLVQELTDAATRLTGAAFGAFFYNVADERGERYTLYTLSGVPRERFAGFPMPRNTELFGPTFQGQGIVRLDDVRQDPRYGRNAPYHGLPPGHLPVVSYLAVPVVARSGEVLGGLFFGHPAAGRFTERHERIAAALAAQASVAMDNARLYQTEQRARAQAEAASRSKDEFLAMLSHELRTPLTAVLGWAVMLRGRSMDEAVRERALAAIERNARAQSQLIEDLLDISRIVSGKLHLDTRPVNLAAVVEAALEAVHPAAHAKGVEIASDLTPVAVVGDPQRLQQVAWNLLSNAVKFTPAGGRVEVRMGSAGEQVELVVRDTGQGIPADALPHIFDRFRQADSTTTRRHGGLGLGLALVKHVVELHGGTVSAASPGPGQGATFTVLLPVAAPAGPTALEVGARRAHETVPSVALDGLRVLVVDDHAETLELFASWLARRGAEVRTASDAAQALAVFPTWRPDVLVSDLAMPGEDGCAFIRKVRGLPAAEGGRVPAIAVTAHGSPEDRLQALASGFQAHIAKPVDPTELVLVIAGLTGRSGGEP